MSHDVFDGAQVSVMRQAIDQITGEGGGLERSEVAHAVFVVAGEGVEFDATTLARMARERLAAWREAEAIACKAASH
jgi:hypothetical protein